MHPGRHAIVTLEVENLSGTTLRSRGRNPVHLGSRWLDPDSGALVLDGPRARLSPGLRAGRTRRLPLRVTAPAEPGDYELRVSMVREHVAWFDELHAGDGLRVRCRVDSAPATASDPPGLPGLTAMRNELEDAAVVFRPSAFWEDLSSLHLAHLEKADGFASFKRSVNLFYFQFLPNGPHPELFRAALRRFLAQPTPRVLAARLEDRGPLEQPEAPDFTRWRVAKLYALYVAILWECVRRMDGHGVLTRLEEPQLGRPLGVRYRGRHLSQDLCNSAHELAAIRDGLGRPLPDSPLMLELGSGYGRVAWAALEVLPGVRYVLVDIPPALAVAQRYLTELHPALPVFRFRRFRDGDAAAEELGRSRIAFLTPNQLERLPPLGADVALTVSSLHEMRPDQIRRYLELIDLHCRGAFYTKQWRRWHNPRDDVVISEADYPYPARWRRMFERPHPLQPGFFEALFETRPPDAVQRA
jgi:putative sugar O-methyltransferase